MSLRGACPLGAGDEAISSFSTDPSSPQKLLIQPNPTGSIPKNRVKIGKIFAKNRPKAMVVES